MKLHDWIVMHVSFIILYINSGIKLEPWWSMWQHPLMIMSMYKIAPQTLTTINIQRTLQLRLQLQIQQSKSTRGIFMNVAMNVFMNKAWTNKKIILASLSFFYLQPPSSSSSISSNLFITMSSRFSICIIHVSTLSIFKYFLICFAACVIVINISVFFSYLSWFVFSLCIIFFPSLPIHHQICLGVYKLWRQMQVVTTLGTCRRGTSILFNRIFYPPFQYIKSYFYRHCCLWLDKIPMHLCSR